MKTINDSTPICLYDESRSPLWSGSWAEFVRDNASMTETGEIDDVRASLEASGIAAVGGGAGPLVFIEVADEGALSVFVLGHAGTARYSCKGDGSPLQAAHVAMILSRVASSTAPLHALVLRDGEPVWFHTPLLSIERNVQHSTRVLNQLYGKSSNKAA